MRDFNELSEALLTPIHQVTAMAPEESVPFILPTGFVLVAGKPGAGKTTFILRLAAMLSENKPLELTPIAMDGGEQFEPEAPLLIEQPGGSLVYLAAEGTPETLRYDFETKVLGGDKVSRPKGKNSTSHRFSFIKNPLPWRIDQEQYRDQILEIIDVMQPTVLVIDPLARFHTVSENETDLAQIFGMFQQAMYQTKGTLVVCHHMRKGGQEKAPRKGERHPVMLRDDIRGTSALSGAADGVIMMRRSTVAGFGNPEEHVEMYVYSKQRADACYLLHNFPGRDADAPDAPVHSQTPARQSVLSRTKRRRRTPRVRADS